MTEREWDWLCFGRLGLHRKIVIRRVGDEWRVAQPMRTSSVGRQTRWVRHFPDFESILTYFRTGEFV